MKPVLVTGASGFLGWHVARLLIERGYSVRALVRPGSRISELEAEPVTGDLRDPESLSRAVAGCGLVFHVAADYRLWAKDPRELYRSNVDGTRALLEAAKRAGVERVVYTSTVGCIGIPRQGLGDENTPVSLADMAGAYKRSKFLAEQAALEFARGGFPVVIVNPTAPVGDHDVKPTPTGQTVLDFLNGKMPAFIDTGLNIVDARDTAEGHLLACERGRPGERYILGAKNIPLAGTPPLAGQQMTFGGVARVDDVQAGVDEGGHLAVEEIEDGLSGGGRLHIVVAHRRRRIDDHNRKPAARKLQRRLLGQKFRALISAGHVGQRNGCIFIAQALAGDADATDRAGVDHTFDPGAFGGFQQCTRAIHIGTV